MIILMWQNLKHESKIHIVRRRFDSVADVNKYALERTGQYLHGKWKDNGTGVFVNGYHSKNHDAWITVTMVSVYD